MKAPKKHIDQFLRQKLKGNKVPVEDSEWDALLSRLPDPNKRKKKAWFFVSSILMLVTIASLSRIYYQRMETVQTQQVAGDSTPVENLPTVIPDQRSETTEKDSPSQAAITHVPTSESTGSGISSLTIPPVPAQGNPFLKQPVSQAENTLLFKQEPPLAKEEIPVITTFIEQDPEIPVVADKGGIELPDTGIDTSADAQDSTMEQKKEKEDEEQRPEEKQKQPLPELPLTPLPGKRHFYVGIRLEVFNAQNTYTLMPEVRTDTIQGSSRHKDYEANMQPSGRSQPSFNFRLLAGISTKTNVSFSTGLEYNKTVQTYDFHFIRNEIPVFDIHDKIIGYIFVPDTLNPDKIQTTVENTVSQLNIPVQAGYTFGIGKRMSIGIQAGGNVGLNFSGEFTALSSRTLVVESQKKATRPFNMGMNGGITLGYTLPKDWVLELGVQYQRQLTNLYNQNIDIRILPYHYGLNLSIKKNILP